MYDMLTGAVSCLHIFITPAFGRTRFSVCHSVVVATFYGRQSKEDDRENLEGKAQSASIFDS